MMYKYHHHTGKLKHYIRRYGKINILMDHHGSPHGEQHGSGPGHPPGEGQDSHHGGSSKHGEHGQSRSHGEPGCHGGPPHGENGGQHHEPPSH